MKTTQLKIKFIVLFLAVLVVISSFNMSVFSAELNVEESPLVSMSIDKTLISEGESATIIVKLKDGYELNYISFKKPITGNSYAIYSFEYVDGEYVGMFDVTDQTESGLWNVNYISYSGFGETFRYLYNSDAYQGYDRDKIDMSFVDFEVVGTDADVAPPKLKSFEIDKTLISFEESATITITVEEEHLAEYISVHYKNPANATKVVNLYQVDDSSVYRGIFEVKSNIVAGEWIANCIYLTDMNENKLFIHNSDCDLSSLNFEVINDNADIEPPVLENFSVSTNVASLGETITFTVEIIEDHPVIDSEEWGLNGLWFDLPSGDSEYVILYSVNNSCVYSGTLVVDENTEVGFWQLDRICLTDENDNTVYIYNSAYNQYGDVKKDLTSLDLEIVNIFNNENDETTTDNSEHIVIFKDGFGTTLSTQKVKHGESAITPQTPTNELYIFDGWDLDFTNITSDLIISAKWVLNPDIVYDFDVTVGDAFEIEVYSTDSQFYTITCNKEVDFSYNLCSMGSVFADKLYYSKGYEVIVNTPGSFIFYIDGSISSNVLKYFVRVSEEPEVTYIAGDANTDGKVDIMDATAIQKHLAGLVILSDEGYAVADVDDSKIVNVMDATVIQKYLAGLETNIW